MTSNRSVSDIAIGIGSGTLTPVLTFFSQDTGTTNTNIVDANDLTKIYAWQYVAQETGNAFGLEIYLGAGSSVGGSFDIEIRNDSADEPGTVIASTTVNVSWLNTSAESWSLVLPSAAQVSTSKYWIYFNPANITGSGNVYAFHGGSASADVNFKQSNDTGSTWGAFVDFIDLRFVLVGS